MPELHEDFNQSRHLPLNIALVTPKQFQKMTKVIADWERSSSGHGMVHNFVDEGDENERSLSEARVSEFIDGGD